MDEKLFEKPYWSLVESVADAATRLVDDHRTGRGILAEDTRALRELCGMLHRFPTAAPGRYRFLSSSTS
jgi:hypothetical protein